MKTESTEIKHRKLKIWLGLATGGAILLALNWHGLVIYDPLLLHLAENFVDFVYRANGWHYAEFGRDLNQRDMEIYMYVLLNVTLIAAVWYRRIILGTIAYTILFGLGGFIARLTRKPK